MSRIKIEIKYLLNSNTEWSTIALLPEDYFEAYEDIAEYSIDDIPKHDLAHGFLPLATKDLIHLVLSISEESNFKEHSYSYWNNGDNFIINVKEGKRNSNEVEEQLIVFNLLESEPLKTEILRFRKVNGFLVPTYHSIIQDQKNGEQDEIKFDTSNSNHSEEKVLA